MLEEFGTVLRYWRQSKGLSQLDLGLEADVSAKHVSFLETGRAKPSREMVALLASTLDVPLADRNILLSSAGFSESYTCMAIDQPEMAPVREALQLMMDNHEPFPVVVMDNEWNLLLANRAYQRMTEQIMAVMPNFPDTQNILEQYFDPNGLRPFVENWDEIASLLLQRVFRERAQYKQGEPNLLDRLLKYPGVPERWKQTDFSGSVQPMATVKLKFGDQKLELFSSLSMFGTAIDITMQQLVIEQYFPVDDSTKEFFKALANLE